jgi:LPS export ABC transporter protein LptC
MHKLNNIRLFLAFSVVLASLVVAATIVSRVRRGAVPKQLVAKLPVQVDLSLQKVHYTETKGGQKRWDLSAERAEYNRDKDTTSLSGVSFTVMGQPSTGDVTVTADRADYHNASKDIELSGNVHGKSGKGLEFSSPRVRYVAARSLLKTSEKVTLADAGLELEGVGMEFETDTRRFRLMKAVSAVYRQQGAR